jgi:cell division protein FtsL
MAAASYGVGYAFDMFEERPVLRSNAAPKREEKKEQPLVKVLPNPRRRAQQETRRSAGKSVKIFVVAAVLLAVLCAQISVGARKYEINRQINEIENEISVAKSENVRLSSVLSNYISISEVEEYATKILGMKKLESYQIEYIDLSGEEGVIYSEESGSFWDIFG